MGKVGLFLSSFKDESSFDDGRSFYASASPYLRVDFSNKDKGYPFEHMILLQGLAKQTRRGNLYVQEFGGFLNWNTIKSKGRSSFSSDVRTDYVMNNTTSESVGRIMGNAEYTYDYLPKSDWKGIVRVRSFFGFNYLFDVSSSLSEYRYGIPLSGMNGNQDVFVEEFFLNRSSERQRTNNRGGFYSGSDFGVADTWMQTNTLFLGIPTPRALIGQVGAFASYGLFERDGVQYQPYSLGLGYELGEYFGLYYAIFESDNLTNAYSSNSFGQRIRISVNIDLFNSRIIPKLYQ